MPRQQPERGEVFQPRESALGRANLTHSALSGRVQRPFEIIGNDYEAVESSPSEPNGAAPTDPRVDATGLG
ncbi:MAG: hypothetical protein P4L46_14415 [Fimbriimonas sp.]|nr:hypothetical protein [Fimbriimonas sp.]